MLRFHLLQGDQTNLWTRIQQKISKLKEILQFNEKIPNISNLIIFSWKFYSQNKYCGLTEKIQLFEFEYFFCENVLVTKLIHNKCCDLTENLKLVGTPCRIDNFWTTLSKIWMCSWIEWLSSFLLFVSKYLG